MSVNLIRIKRKRGGQKGNQNARKHGFYSRSLNPDELSQFWNILSQEDIEPEIAFLRIKLHSFLSQQPVNPHGLARFTRLLVKWYSVKYYYTGAKRRLCKNFIVGYLEQNAGVSLIQTSHRREQQVIRAKRIVRTRQTESFEVEILDT